MIFRGFLPILGCALALACGALQAQQYRWIDRDGRVQYTDAPPPAWAKDVRRSAPPAEASKPQVPFELAKAQKDFPVTLYTSPSCKEGCELARSALGKRGVPYKEVQVWNQETNDELKQVSGALEVPTLVVGRTVQKGFQPEDFEALLDSAGYPKAGILPETAQKAPAPPEGYVPASQSEPTAQPVAPPPPAPKPGRYDPSGLVGPPQKPGRYNLPAEGK